jgi:hypothetical protein
MPLHRTIFPLWRSTNWMHEVVNPMKRHKCRARGSAIVIGTVLFLMLQSFSPFAACAADMQLEALLVWGTNQEKSPEPKHKAVDAD